jgi:excisionase family DNA binding protein
MTATKIEPLLLRVDEAAEALALSRTKVYELMASGELESVKVGRARRVPTAALVDFLEVSRPYSSHQGRSHRASSTAVEA